MYDITTFGLSDLVRLSAALRAPGEAESMEGAARAVVTHLYDNLLDKATGDRSSVLVRFYKTHAYSALPADVRAFAAGLRVPGDDDPCCLTLLASAGLEAEWNDRRRSAGHQAIPLSASDAAERSPMVHRLISDLGLDVGTLLAPSPLEPERHARTYNVFHVSEAAGSPYVPAQDDFVAPYGIRSVLGFGGLLPDGSLFAVVVFSRTPIRREVADLFSSVALGVGLAALPFVDRVFDEDPPAPPDPEKHDRWTASALDQLLAVREQVILEQALRVEQAMVALEERADELTRSREVLAASEARKRAIVDASLDAIVTIDAHGTILEFNPAAEAMFGYDHATAVGASMSELMVPPSLRPAHAAGMERHLETGEARIIGRRVEVPAMHASGREFPAELTLARIDTSREGPVFTAHIRDMTEMKRREDELRELADTLQAGLLPPLTPAIPGLDIATHYSAGGAGLQVGGDFYDIFRLADDHEWGVVIGDVCGKGARAASVTSLVRYTARAAAAHGGDPAEVLHEMNAAVLGGDDTGPDDRYCSAIYATLRVGEGFVDVTACSGGHPAALLVRTDGHVEQVGAGGQLIGLFEEYETECVDVRLLPGDFLVLYTDGVTEARAADGTLYGEERLEAVLARAAGRKAREVSDSVVADLLSWADETGDDVALVVLRAATPAA